MTNEQLYVVISIPMLFNAVLMGLLLTHLKARFDRIETRLDAIDQRFDDALGLWRAELRRSEERI